MSEELTAGQRVALAVKAGGTEADAEAHGAPYASVRLGRVIEARAPKEFERLLSGEIGVTKAYRLATHGEEPPAHPAAAIFPMMGAEDRAALKASLEKSGYREGEPPVLLHPDGRIIDGRNRASVCDELGLEYPTAIHEGAEEEILALVLSRNLARRQLTNTQREMVAAKIAGQLSKESVSAVRAAAALGRWVPKTEAAQDAMQKAHLLPLHTSANETAAKIMGVSAGNVKRARKVLDSGDKKLIADVEAGKMKVSQAAKSLGPSPRKKPTPIKETGAKPGRTSPAPATAPRQPKAPNPYEDVALQFSNAINRIEEIAARLDAAKLRSVFPGELVKNLDISLEKASEFLAAMWAVHAATKKNAADGPAAPLNLH
jgi:hypothetical protein